MATPTSRNTKSYQGSTESTRNKQNHIRDQITKRKAEFVKAN